MQSPNRPGSVLAPRFRPGALLGQYRVEARIGSGAMGEVFRATHVGLDRPVALKVLQPELARQPSVLQRFRTEAVATARLRHPHILEVTDFAQDGQGNAFLVMELLEGQPVDAFVREVGAVRLGDAITLLDQMLQALECAHRAGIIHRDLKPANLFLCKQPTPGIHLKVLDFGLAKQTLGAAQHLTTTGEILGTPAYMAPEQVEGGTIDARTDLYAVGSIGFELLTGTLPFAGSALNVMMAQIMEPLPAWTRQPPLPALEAWVRRAMEKKPAARFQSATEMRAALRASAPADSNSGPGAAEEAVDDLGATLIDRKPPRMPGAGGRALPPSAPVAPKGRASELDLLRAGVRSRFARLRAAALAVVIVVAIYGLYLLSQR